MIKNNYIYDANVKNKLVRAVILGVFLALLLFWLLFLIYRQYWVIA
jgi:hypothetical protein